MEIYKMLLISLIILIIVSADQYNDVIFKSDLFYISPVPNVTPISLKTNSLKNFKGQFPIKIIIHGYLGDKEHVAIIPIRNAFLSQGYDSIFMADWSESARIQYFASRYFVGRVGKLLARILKKFLRLNNIKTDDVHIIGHSLGAHISGVIGRLFNGTIGRITGLDPALPLFDENSNDDLKADCAKYVDIIHTGASFFGDAMRRGHVDFYPNSGITSQPGCQSLDLITFTSCSHLRAPLFYAESIQLPKNFPAVSCPFDIIQNGSGQSCYDRVNASIAFMGEQVSKRVRGVYYLETNNVAPFGRGFYSRNLSS